MQSLFILWHLSYESLNLSSFFLFFLCLLLGSKFVIKYMFLSIWRLLFLNYWVFIWIICKFSFRIIWYFFFFLWWCKTIRNFKFFMHLVFYFSTVNHINPWNQNILNTEVYEYTFQHILNCIKINQAQRTLKGVIFSIFNSCPKLFLIFIYKNIHDFVYKFFSNLSFQFIWIEEKHKKQIKVFRSTNLKWILFCF